MSGVTYEHEEWCDAAGCDCGLEERRLGDELTAARAEVERLKASLAAEKAAHEATQAERDRWVEEWKEITKGIADDLKAKAEDAAALAREEVSSWVRTANALRDRAFAAEARADKAEADAKLWESALHERHRFVEAVLLQEAKTLTELAEAEKYRDEREKYWKAREAYLIADYDLAQRSIAFHAKRADAAELGAVVSPANVETLKGILRRDIKVQEWDINQLGSDDPRWAEARRVSDFAQTLLTRLERGGEAGPTHPGYTKEEVAALGRGLTREEFGPRCSCGHWRHDHETGGGCSGSCSCAAFDPKEG